MWKLKCLEGRCNCGKWPANKVGAAIEAGIGIFLMVLSPREHVRLVFCCCFFLLFRALCFKKLNDKHLQLYKVLCIPSHYIHLLASIHIHLRVWNWPSACVPDHYWGLYPSKETVPSLLSSMPLAAPSQLRYTSPLLPPHLHPWHRDLLLLMSKGIAYI